MTRAIMACWMGIALLFIAGSAHGQNFDYSFSASTGTYQSLGGATTVSTGTDWSNSMFRIPIGFSFGFNNASFDSVTIEGNGFLKFSGSNAVVLFHGAGCKSDSNNVYSLLSYTSTGSAGNKIFKIQYTNTGYDKYNTAEHLNYQVWLYEQDKKLEIRTGSNSYPGEVDSTGNSPLPLIGLIDPLQSGTVNGLLLSGDPGSPAPQPFSPGSSLSHLDFIPPANKIYTFTPSSN